MQRVSLEAQLNKKKENCRRLPAHQNRWKGKKKDKRNNDFAFDESARQRTTTGIPIKVQSPAAKTAK
jgi:hypothetical protein